MKDYEIQLPTDTDFVQLERIIDRAITVNRLTTTLRSTLKKYPGCLHWHVKNGQESGTLEITLWPLKQRAWFTIQDGRQGSWIKEKMSLVNITILDNCKLFS